MPAKRPKKLTARTGHWYRMRAGGFAKVIRFLKLSQRDSSGMYPHEALIYRSRHSSVCDGSYESYLDSGHALGIDREDDHDLVEDLGTTEPREVAAFRELISWAKAALNGQEDCIAIVLPPQKRRPASKQQKG